MEGGKPAGGAPWKSSLEGSRGSTSGKKVGIFHSIPVHSKPWAEWEGKAVVCRIPFQGVFKLVGQDLWGGQGAAEPGNRARDSQESWEREWDGNTQQCPRETQHPLNRCCAGELEGKLCTAPRRPYKVSVQRPLTSE